MHALGAARRDTTRVRARPPLALDLGISRDEKVIVFVLLAAGFTESFTSTLLSPSFPSLSRSFRWTHPPSSG